MMDNREAFYVRRSENLSGQLYKGRLYPPELNRAYGVKFERTASVEEVSDFLRYYDHEVETFKEKMACSKFYPGAYARSSSRPADETMDPYEVFNLATPQPREPIAGGGTKETPVPEPRPEVKKEPPAQQTVSLHERQLGEKAARQWDSPSPPRVDPPSPVQKRDSSIQGNWDPFAATSVSVPRVIKKFREVSDIQDALIAKLKQSPDKSAIETEYAKHQDFIDSLDTSKWTEGKITALGLRQKIIGNLYKKLK